MRSDFVHSGSFTLYNLRMKPVLGKDGDKACIYVGDIPNVYDDESWTKSERILQKIWEIIKSEFVVSKGNDKNSFIIESNEFFILMDDLMPIGIYTKEVSGNPIIEKIFETLNRY